MSFTALRRTAAWLRRHPLAQFLLIGAILYAAYAVIHPESDPLSRRIRIGDGEVRWLADTFENQFGHRPNHAELDALVANYVDDEMKVREALAMGLDRDDSVIRRRLIQKYDFIAAPDVPPAPADTVLRKWYDSHPANYIASPSLSFCQVYVAPEPDRPTAIARTHAVTAQLARGEHPEGDPLDTEPCENDVDAAAIAREYGVNFAQALGSVPLDTWTGPVESSFGFHAVKVTARGKPTRIPFGTARADVLSDWQRAEQLAGRKKLLETLRARYSVSVDKAAVERAIATAPGAASSYRRDDPMPEMGADESGE